MSCERWPGLDTVEADTGRLVNRGTLPVSAAGGLAHGWGLPESMSTRVWGSGNFDIREDREGWLTPLYLGLGNSWVLRGPRLTRQFV